MYRFSVTPYKRVNSIQLCYFLSSRASSRPGCGVNLAPSPFARQTLFFAELLHSAARVVNVMSSSVISDDSSDYGPTPTRLSETRASSSFASTHSSPVKSASKASDVDVDENIRVIGVVRPLIGHEIEQNCSTSVIVEGDAIAMKNGRQFTFDGAFTGTDSELAVAYNQHVKEIVHGLLDGYNGTVLAYGQTGSGKTHTMGTGGKNPGMASKVFHTLCSVVTSARQEGTVKIKATFIEIYKEDIRDLLAPSAEVSPAIVSIREHAREGGVHLTGAQQVEADDVEALTAALNRGIRKRATASNSQNIRSSRSHAIFTIYVERKARDSRALAAKLHLVDLAGSERVTQQDARGQRFKEGVQINMGLLALSNCISALSDSNRREWGHVPYRDSKLTRFLQDSLGGNSRTVMLACCSPADINAEETLNTLKYANRVKKIRNRVSINIEKASPAEIKLRQELATATERIEQLETLVTLLHDENIALKSANPTVGIQLSLSDLNLVPPNRSLFGDSGASPGTPASKPRAMPFTPEPSESPLSELLQSCKRARQRAEILLSSKSPVGTPIGSFKTNQDSTY